MQVGIIVLGHDVENLVRGDEQLLAALLNGNPLGRVVLVDHRDMLLDLFDRLEEALGLDRLHEVVDRVDLEGLDGMLAIGRDEHDRRRARDLRESLGQLQARRARHVDVEEHHVAAVVLEVLDGFAHVARLGHDLDLAGLLEQVLELRPRRSLVINDHRTYQG